MRRVSVLLSISIIFSILLPTNLSPSITSKSKLEKKWVFSHWFSTLKSPQSESHQVDSHPLEINTVVIHVPEEISNLQDAINLIPDGGIIEIATGTYQNGNKAFIISNLQKGFTIRAAQGASVTLTGAGSHDIIRYQNSNINNGKMVFFEGLLFGNGYSATNGIAGGVTMRLAKATFNNCTFSNNNGNQPSTGGGAIVVADQSIAFFNNTKWLDNRAKFYGAGLDIADGALVYLSASEFQGNRTNYPNHHPSSSGAGIHLGNSTLYVNQSHFENNQAGYVGGAIYANGVWKDPITTPRSRVYINNSTFTNNLAKKDASVSQTSPTEAGAVHAEDQTLLLINNSIFTTNNADTGGAVNLYRAQAEITNSIFLGNQAVGPGAARAFGGAISALSDDGSNTATNYPSARLVVRSVYIQGRYQSITTTAMAAAGIYAAGDRNRQYGLNGINKKGTLSENRVKLTLENVILYDLDVKTRIDNQGGTGTGGALLADLAEVNAKNVLVMRSDASGNDGQGGGFLFANNTLANLVDITVAGNSAEKFGGGLLAQGSEIHLSDSQFFENEISPGVSEPILQSYGAAIFTAPDDVRNLWAIGEVRTTIITNNKGLPVFDDDRSGEPIRINETRYNANKFYNNTFGDLVYGDSLVAGRVNAVGLNNLVVTRSNGTSTDKSILANTQTSTAIIVGDILAVPPFIDMANGLTTVYIGFAWSGGPATLNGNTVVGNTGVIPTSSPGTYTLLVNGVSFQVQVREINPTLYIPNLYK